jgi:hypothetical protein
MDVLQSRWSRCRLLASLSSFRFAFNASLMKYSSFVDSGPISRSSFHQPLSFHTKKRPPIERMQSMISRTTLSRLDLTVPRLGSTAFGSCWYLLSTRRCTLEFPGYDIEWAPCRNKTSSNCGHSMTSELDSECSRSFNHCFMYPSLMFPENVRGMCSVGIP